MDRHEPARAASAAPDAWPFRSHRTLATVIAAERTPTDLVDQLRAIAGEQQTAEAERIVIDAASELQHLRWALRDVLLLTHERLRAGETGRMVLGDAVRLVPGLVLAEPGQ